MHARRSHSKVKTHFNDRLQNLVTAPNPGRTTVCEESPRGAIKVHYFNNRTDSSEPAAPDDRKQHSLATGQAVKKCRNPVFPIIGCVPAVFLAQCSYPLQWIYPPLPWRSICSSSVTPNFTRFFKLCFLPEFADPLHGPLRSSRKGHKFWFAKCRHYDFINVNVCARSRFWIFLN